MIKEKKMEAILTNNNLEEIGIEELYNVEGGVEASDVLLLAGGIALCYAAPEVAVPVAVVTWACTTL